MGAVQTPSMRGSAQVPPGVPTLRLETVGPPLELVERQPQSRVGSSSTPPETLSNPWAIHRAGRCLTSLDRNAPIPAYLQFPSYVSIT